MPKPVNSRKSANFRIWHGPCNQSGNRSGRAQNPRAAADRPTRMEKCTMKTLTYLSASLILTLSLMAATVAVPLSSAPIFA